MHAGRLRHTVEIQSPTLTQDTNGRYVNVYNTALEVKAAIEPLRVNERFMAAQEHASATHRITFHKRRALDAMDGSWRVKYGERIFPLTGLPINLDEENRYTQLLCEEGLKDE